MADNALSPCPNCGSGKVRFTSADLDNGRMVRCSHGCAVELTDLSSGFRRTEREIERLEQQIAELSRALRFMR